MVADLVRLAIHLLHHQVKVILAVTVVPMAVVVAVVLVAEVVLPLAHM
jgi:hypothetical protein